MQRKLLCDQYHRRLDLSSDLSIALLRQLTRACGPSFLENCKFVMVHLCLLSIFTTIFVPISRPLNPIFCCNSYVKNFSDCQQLDEPEWNTNLDRCSSALPNAWLADVEVYVWVVKRVFWATDYWLQRLRNQWPKCFDKRIIPGKYKTKKSHYDFRKYSRFESMDITSSNIFQPNAITC